jgi:hypothetical protein
MPTSHENLQVYISRIYAEFPAPNNNNNNVTPASLRLAWWERLQALTLPLASLKAAFCTAVLDIHCPFHAPHIDLYQTVQPSATTLASHSPPPEPKPLPANIARKRHVSANERPAPSDNIQPPSQPKNNDEDAKHTNSSPSSHTRSRPYRSHTPPTSPTLASHANAMSRPTRRTRIPESLFFTPGGRVLIVPRRALSKAHPRRQSCVGVFNLSKGPRQPQRRHGRHLAGHPHL